METVTPLSSREKLAYRHGVKRGLVMYAYWENGTSVVGSAGITLERALAIAAEERIPTTLAEDVENWERHNAIKTSATKGGQ